MLSSTPRCTYRLQLRNGVDFARAGELAPYLARLGVSHLYISPPFLARTGSEHGYDVADPTRLDPALGGEDGFVAMCERLHEHGLGLLVDIVPNHMGIGPDNPWWWDVLEHGRNSRYTGFFDIAWEHDPDGKLVLPVLGEGPDDVLAKGELKIVAAGPSGRPELHYYTNRFPLAPGTELPQGDGAGDADSVRRVLDAQAYRLVAWQEGKTRRNYRRFFDVNELAAVRAEDPAVFEATHALILDLIGRGLIQGLRVDHVDGLADPKGYLEHLRQRVDEVWRGPDRFYLLVEKILVGGEQLRPDWPIAGTTGYEFMNQVLHLLIQDEGLPLLEEQMHAVTSEPDSYADITAHAKAQVLDLLFSGERAALVRRAAPLLGSEAAAKDLLTALLVRMPVYRTYCRDGACDEADRNVLHHAIEQARWQGPCKAPGGLDRLERLLLSEAGRPDVQPVVRSLQLLSGPLMAKAVEDTAFYRFPRLLALNEVGGEPDAEAIDAGAFHRLNRERFERWPDTMTATATHDTKRGEDLRARLAILSEIADIWAEQVSEWQELNAQARAAHPIHPKDEHTLYQTMLGTWPTDTSRDDPMRAGLRKRLTGAFRKTLREAKERTSWLEPDETYEAAALGFLEQITDPLQSSEFLAELTAFVHRIAGAGVVNSFAQTLLKLTTPGVPDIYQGSELGDFNLVDPDNRRPVDFELCAKTLADDIWINDPFVPNDPWIIKQQIIARVLAFRRNAPELFARGEYLPLEVEGSQADRIVAFARRLEGQCAVVVVSRHIAPEVIGTSNWRLPPERWRSTAIALPDRPKISNWRNVLDDGKPIGKKEQLLVRDLLTDLPVALLTAGPT